MTQLIVFPEHVFPTITLPIDSTRMPRSAPLQLLPSIRLSALVVRMPAPIPEPVPFPAHSFSVIRHAPEHPIPSTL